MDATELVSTWLQAVGRADWQTVWECHAPEALILAGPQVIQRQNVGPDQYALFQQTVTQHTDPLRLRRFQMQSLALQSLPELAVVTAHLGELTTGYVVPVAFLISRSGLAGIAVDPPMAERGLVQAMADLAQVPATNQWQHMYLTALHHGFERRRVGLQATLRALPDARFTCQSRGECCHVGKWNALLSDNEWQAAKQLTAALGVADLVLKTPAEPPGFPSATATNLVHSLAGTATGACHALGADRSCAIHAALGWQPLPVCATYPIGGIRTPDGLDVTAYFSCKTVCHNEGTLLAEQNDDFRARFWSPQHRLRHIPADLLRVAGETETMPWTEYRELEAAWLDVLARLPQAGSAVLAEGTALAIAGQGRAVSGDLRLDGLFRFMLGDKPPDAPWKGGWMGGRYRQAWELVQRQFVFYRSDNVLVSRYLRTVLFRKPGLPEAGIGFAWGMTLLAFRMIVEDARFRACREGHPETSADDVLSAVRATEALIGHAGLATGIQAYAENHLESPAAWAALLP